MIPPRKLRPDELVWACAWMAVNAAVLIGIAALIPVFRRMAEAAQVPGNIRICFYLVAALAMANAIRRLVLQYLRLRHPRDPDEEDDRTPPL
ncbi:MAG: hypothetical protein HZB25_01640 [Candidatus Eisenbacteria bacterium]|nr:hypothetical protein [Candidatus Eisenbacteria bacterium]